MLKTTIIGGLAMAVVLGFAPGAPARTVKALIGVASQPTGTRFTTSSGNWIWAAASGVNSVGVQVCGARAYANNTWTTASSCPATAVKHRAQLRSVEAIYCSSTPVAWNSQQVCWVSDMLIHPNGGATPVNVGTVQAWSDPVL